MRRRGKYHDHGDFVSTYLADAGWTMLDGEIIDAPWGGALLGIDDPRSSGLGNWREETGLSFGEVEDRLADTIFPFPESLPLG